jgi:hypothetical protein
MIVGVCSLTCGQFAILLQSRNQNEFDVKDWVEINGSVVVFLQNLHQPALESLNASKLTDLSILTVRVGNFAIPRAIAASSMQISDEFSLYDCWSYVLTSGQLVIPWQRRASSTLTRMNSTH